jgi:cysteine desulfurase
MATSGIEMKGIKLRGAPMYLDMQATTPLDPRVLDAMLPYMVDQVGPHQDLRIWKGMSTPRYQAL